MYSMDIRTKFNLGILHLFLINNNGDDNYQILFIYLIWILMALIKIFIFMIGCWNISKIKKSKLYNLYLYHNITFVTTEYGVVYLLIVILLILIIRILTLNKVDIYFINFIVFCILVIWILLIMQTKLIIEIFFDLLRFYIKKLFGFYQEINYFEWYFVGLKNKPKALLYHMLNSWRKIIYLIPIYLIFISIFIFEDYKMNVVYVLAMIIISSMEITWLVYIWKVYPYDSLSHNRIIIVNQISVVFIWTLGVFTVKNKVL